MNNKKYPYIDNLLLDLKHELSGMGGSTVLITGGYGMLLSYVTLLICAYNAINTNNRINLILVVRNSKKAKNKLGPYHGFKYAKLIESDMGTNIDIDGSVDYIIHGAGYGSPKDYLEKTDLVFKSNIIGTHNLLNLAREKKTKSFLYVSSGAVYGNNFDFEVVDEDFIGTVNYNEASSFYSETKRFSELICSTHKFKGKLVILRPAHIYGPTMDLENDNRVLCGFVRSKINNEPLEILSDGNDKRSFCHVSDFTSGLIKVLVKGKSGEKYNIGNDDMYMSINKLSEIFRGAYPDIKINRSPVSNRKNYNKMLMSSKKLQELGWSPKINLEDGITSTINFYNNMVEINE